VSVCVRVHEHVHTCTSHTLTHSFVVVCAFHEIDACLYSKAAPFSFCCVTPGSPWSSMGRSCIERTRVASAAPRWPMGHEA
jgi:hypothetical protein